MFILRTPVELSALKAVILYLFPTRYFLACQWTTALCIKCRSIWKQVIEIYRQSQSRLYWRDAHENSMRLIAQR